MYSHFATDMPNDLLAGIEFDFELSVGQCFGDLTFKLYCIVLPQIGFVCLLCINN
jgi:hypothetical protein